MTDDFTDVIQNDARLEALRRTSLLDSPPEEAFDRLTRMATTVLRVPAALVSLVDRDRLFFKSQSGLAEPLASLREGPVQRSFCQYAVRTRETLVVPDSRRNPAFECYPAISGLGAIAYAGVPLITSEGHALGTFCVVDERPREWTEEEVGVLRVLATCAMSEIELRRRVDELRSLTTNLQGLVESRTAALKASEEHQRVLLDVNNAIVTCHDRDSLFTSIAAALARQGIKPTIRTSIAPDISVGDEILNRLADLDADLLVMGAYGHSRMRELVFGGTTRRIARHMTVPTLFSH